MKAEKIAAEIRKLEKQGKTVPQSKRDSLLKAHEQLMKSISASFKLTLPQDKASVKPLLVGGGVGTAPMLMLGSTLAEMGYKPTFLLGARSSKDLLQLDEFQKLGDVYMTTEDGSMGEKGYVTQHSVLEAQKFDMIYTCGPKPMMMAVAKYAKANGIECEVSLENTMACGVGACLCCVENTDEGHLCVCKDGPVFNIKKLLWQI